MTFSNKDHFSSSINEISFYKFPSAPLQFFVVGTHSAIMRTDEVVSKKEFAIVRAFFSATKILPLETIIERGTRLTDFFLLPHKP